MTKVHVRLKEKSFLSDGGSTSKQIRARDLDKNIKEIKDRLQRRQARSGSRLDVRDDAIVPPRQARDVRYKPERTDQVDIDGHEFESDLDETTEEKENEGSMMQRIIKMTRNEKEKFDPCGGALYEAWCKRLDLHPVREVINSLPKKNMTVRYRTLDEMDMRALGPALEVNSFLESLDLSCNKLTSSGCCRLVTALTNNYFITHLDISYNLIDEEGLCAVADLLIDNSTITALDLSGNTFGDKSSHNLQRLLMENTSLRDLCLSNCHLAESAGTSFRRILCDTVTLTRLDLSWNHIRENAAVDICKGLKNNCSLTHLDLSWNGFGESGAMEMGAALKSNSTLLSLNLDCNRINKAGAVQLSKGLQANSALQELKLVRNPIHPDGAQAILQALDKNKSRTVTLLDLSENPVRSDFINSKHKLQEEYDVRVLYGDIVSEGYPEITSDIRHSIRELGKKSDEDPYNKLMNFCMSSGLRLKDLFSRLDLDKDNFLTIHEVMVGIQRLGIDLSEEEIEDLFEMLDENNDGVIEKREMIFGDKAYRQEQRAVRRTKEEKRQELLEELDDHDDISSDFIHDIKLELKQAAIAAGTAKEKRVRWTQNNQM